MPHIKTHHLSALALYILLFPVLSIAQDEVPITVNQITEHTTGNQMDLDLGNMTLSLRYNGGLAHSSSDILIFCPEEGLLITGDLIYQDNLYFDSEPGHEDLLPVTIVENHLEAIKAMKKELSGKESAFFAFRKEYETNGLKASMKKMKQVHSQPKRYYFLHPEFDTFVYRLMLGNQLTDAQALFEMVAQLCPDIDVAWDSLGEVYLRLENKEKARESFTKCLALNPDNDNAKTRLEELD